MLTLVTAALLFQQTSISIGADSKKGGFVKIVAAGSNDSVADGRNKRRAIVATAEQIASAFGDASTRRLLERARVARLGQDSSIQSYESTTLQRLTLGLGFSKLGRDRIFFRHEAAARVRWARSVGAQIDVTGKRTAIPMLGGESEVDIENILSPVPYYPGRDALWFGLSRSVTSVAEDAVVHPLAAGAEAFYTYRSGDSITFRLPDGSVVQLRELEVRPRVVQWRTVVGSLWFDTSTGQLVRAAYRMSQPFDFMNGDDGEKKPGFISRAVFRPANATAKGVAIEYGLYQGKYWMPRSQVLEADVTVGFARMPLRMEEHFAYVGVNGLDSLPVVPPRDTTPAPRTAQARQRRDSVLATQQAAECATTGMRTQRATRYGGSLPVVVHVPCDTAMLARSPALPPSIFDSGESVFGDAERDALLAKAEQMMPPVPLTLRAPRVDWGLDLLRYNRVEGLSTGLDVTEELGANVLRFTPRIGVADRIPNVELALSRTSGAGTISIGGYRRLAVVNDWGHPLDFGSGASALLFGRDEGFYFRSEGAEIASDVLLGGSIEWRVFHEQESDAVARTDFSLAHAVGAGGFRPLPNIDASRIRETGVSIRNVSSFGLDPDGLRLLSDVRVEGAIGDRDFARAAGDFTLSHTLGRVLRRDFAGAFTVGAGTTAGTVPVQRLWYLGGTSTVRGEAAGAMVGDSYWLTRTELGYGSPGLRRIAFFDMGWAGSRTNWSGITRPASGVGVGFSLLDGLIRADVARGLYPEKSWRSALYLEAKF